jgi:hypothetical protein
MTIVHNEPEIDLETRVARAIWLAENMKGGSSDWVDAAKAAILAVREWDANRQKLGAAVQHFLSTE